MADRNWNERELLKAALGRTAHCLTPEVLAEIAQNPAGGDNTAAAHLSACPHCQAELELLREFHMAAPRPEEADGVAWIESELRRRAPEWKGAELAAAAPASRPAGFAAWAAAVFGPRHRRAWSFAAASLMVALAAGVYLWHPDQVRPGAEPQVWRSQQFAATSPAGDIAASPSEFKWQTVDRAAKYQVRLMEVDRTVIWTAESSNTTVEIPNNLQKQLTPGRSFLWDVVAFDASGVKLGSTNLQSFHITITTH